MTEPKTFQKKPVRIKAVQWDGSDERADELWEWTAKSNAVGNAWPTMFMVLGDYDAYDVFGDYDDELEVVGTAVKDRIEQGYSAVVRDVLHDTWVNVATGDWIIQGLQGEFYPCKPDVFDASYDEVAE